jgi:hypothetical protein
MFRIEAASICDVRPCRPTPVPKSYIRSTDAHPQAENIAHPQAKNVNDNKAKRVARGEALEANFVAPRRRITVEQARQLIEAHFATIAQRSTARVKAEEG